MSKNCINYEMKMYSLVLKIYIKIRKIKIKQDSNESNFITFLYAKSGHIATKFRIILLPTGLIFHEYEVVLRLKICDHTVLLERQDLFFLLIGGGIQIYVVINLSVQDI